MEVSQSPRGNELRGEISGPNVPLHWKPHWWRSDPQKRSIEPARGVDFSADSHPPVAEMDVRVRTSLAEQMWTARPHVPAPHTSGPIASTLQAKHRKASPKRKPLGSAPRWRDLAAAFRSRGLDADESAVLEGFITAAVAAERALKERLAAPKAVATTKSSPALLNLQQALRSSVRRRDYAKAACLRDEVLQLGLQDRARRADVAEMDGRARSAAALRTAGAAVQKLDAELCEELWRHVYVGRLPKLALDASVATVLAGR